MTPCPFCKQAFSARELRTHLPQCAKRPAERNEEQAMLTIYRRHVKNCDHRAEGRKYRRCRCPIWADGFLNGTEIHELLDLRDWEKA
jgi:hypothetical protein